MLCWFFFQAEDGIRDLVRSRGLGDVYKRQGKLKANDIAEENRDYFLERRYPAFGNLVPRDVASVSYTHLTLPTSDLV